MSDFNEEWEAVSCGHYACCSCGERDQFKRHWDEDLEWICTNCNTAQELECYPYKHVCRMIKTEEII